MIPILEKLKDKVKKEKISVGLDIGVSTVKLVRLRFLKDAVELYGFSIEPLQSDLNLVIKNIIQAKDLNKVNTSVSGPATIIRYVNFPQMKNEELRQALKFEAQKHIPFPIEQLNLDSYILKENLPDNKMLVLLAAVKKEFLNQRLKLLEELGLRANIIDIDSVALINAFNFNYPKDTDNIKLKTIALLNIGASESNLNILDDGLPRLSRDIHIAGNNFTQKLVDVLGIDFKPAENIKINPDQERAEKISSAVDSLLPNLASEIRTSFDYYESQNASSVGKIFLSGGGSLFSGLKDMLANLLGIEVEYWDPLKKISIANSVDAQVINKFSSQLAIAVGLALRT